MRRILLFVSCIFLLGVHQGYSRQDWIDSVKTVLSFGNPGIARDILLEKGDPENPDHLLWLAEANRKSGDLAAACQILSKVNAFSLSPTQAFQSGEILLKSSLTEKEYALAGEILALLQALKLPEKHQELTLLEMHFRNRTRQFDQNAPKIADFPDFAELDCHFRYRFLTETGVYWYFQKSVETGPDSARYYLESAEALENSCPIDPEYAIYLRFYLGRLIKLSGDLEAYETELRKGYDIMGKLGVSTYFNPFIIRGLGYCALETSRLDTARKYYEIVLEFAEYKEDTLLMVDLCDNLGNTLYESQGFHEAQEFYKREIELLNAFHAPDPSKRARALHNLTNVLTMTGEVKEENYREALDAFLQENNPNYEHLSRTAFSLGWLLYSIHQVDSATHYLQQSLDYLERVYPAPAYQHAEIYLLLALWAGEQKNFQEAREYLALANRNLEQDHLTPELSWWEFYDSRARILQWEGNWNAALQDVQLALNQLSLADDPVPFPENPEPEKCLRVSGLIDVLQLKANLLLQSAGQAENPLEIRERALQTFETAVIAGRLLAKRLRSDLSKIQNSNSLEPVFEQAIGLACELYRETGNPEFFRRGFLLSERSKAFVLLQNITESEAFRLANVPDSLQKKKQDLEADISALEWKQGQETGSTRTTTLAELNAKRRDEAKLMDNLTKNYPKLGLLLKQTPVPGVEAIHKAFVNDTTTLVEFFKGKAHLYSFLLHPDTNLFICQPLDSTFDKAVNYFFNEVDTNTGTRLIHGEFQQSSQTLYQTIIDPLADHLTHRLILIPHGNLNYIPFAALLSPEKEASKFSNARFFIQDHDLSYHYSTALLLESQLPRMQRPEYDIIGFAPDFRKGVTPLKGSTEHLPRIERKFANAKTFVLDQARKETFLAQADNARILYFATHTLVDFDQPLNSRMLFSPSSASDDRLFLHELYSLRAPVDLAILESCKSGYGKLRGGEGMMSLARGFTSAGCRSILMALWEVSDQESTKEIIDLFYEGLANGLPKDRALAEAQRGFLEDVQHGGGLKASMAHPFFWGELVLIGNAENVPLKRLESNQNLWFWMGCGGILLILLLLLKRKFPGRSQGIHSKKAK